MAKLAMKIARAVNSGTNLKTENSTAWGKAASLAAHYGFIVIFAKSPGHTVWTGA